MKTQDLLGIDLDLMVAKALKLEPVTRGRLGTAYCWDAWGRPCQFRPSTDWSIGGPLIQEYEIDIYCHTSQKQEPKNGFWLAEITGSKAKGSGPTVLIAAMRCFLASKLGDNIELPE